MCELLGINSNCNISPEFTFKEFAERGGKKGPHKDGWGIAFFKNGLLELKKEAKPAFKSKLAKKIEEGKEKVLSKIIIAHIRQASTGKASVENTHPFSFKLFGRQWVFAHNGTVGRRQKTGVFKLSTNDSKFPAKGETDSEKAFAFLLSRLGEECNARDSLEKIARVVLRTARQVQKMGKFNFLMSEGKHFFAFGDNPLYYLQKPSSETARLDDADYSIKVGNARKGEKTIVAATKPLTREKWKKFEKGQLLVFKNGRILFDSKK